MGFADGLRELLGGFNAVRRIDQDGFDWREKDAAAQFERDRARQVAGQQDEDRAVGQVTDALSAQDFDREPDLSAVQPLMQGIAQERQKALLETALGKRKQQKNYLEMLRGNNASTLQGLKAEQAAELARLKEKLRNERTLSPADLAKMEQLERIKTADRTSRETIAEENRDAAGERFDRSQATRNQPKARMVLVRQGDKNVYRWIQPGENGYEQAMPATMVQSQGMAQGVGENIERMEDMAKTVTQGPILGNISKLYQRVAGPEGDEGEFDFLGNALVDNVYVKSGKQINESEMALLREMVPTRARGNVPEQVRLFKRYARTLLAKYGIKAPEFDDSPDDEPRPRQVSPGAPSAPATPQPGSPQPTPQGGGQHGPPVKRKRMPDGSTMFRDAQGNTWQE
jgi:hypothetical protein